MDPHVHIGSETAWRDFLWLPVILFLWRLIQMWVKNTEAGPVLAFIFH